MAWRTVPLMAYSEPWFFHNRSSNTIETKERFYFSSVASQTSDTLLPDLNWILIITLPYHHAILRQKVQSKLLFEAKGPGLPV